MLQAMHTVNDHTKGNRFVSYWNNFLHAAITDVLSCSFEDSSLCEYGQDSTDQFDWTMKAGSTSTVGTGPMNDHTYGTNQGVFVQMIYLWMY